MTRKINPVPKGYRTATPALVVRNAAAAIDCYSTVFGATEVSRLYAEDGVTIVRAEIKIGNSILHVSDEVPAIGLLSPTSLGGVAGSVQLFIEDLDDAWARAIENGAQVLLPLTDTYWGERTGRILDAFGQVWTMSKIVESVSKAELEKRIAALSAPVQAEAEEIPTVDVRNVELTSETDPVLI